MEKTELGLLFYGLKFVDKTHGQGGRYSLDSSRFLDSISPFTRRCSVCLLYVYVVHVSSSLVSRKGDEYISEKRTYISS